MFDSGPRLQNSADGDSFLKDCSQSIQTKSPGPIRPSFQPTRDQKGISKARQAPPVYRPTNASSAAIPSQLAAQAKQKATKNQVSPQPYRPVNLSTAQQRSGVAPGMNNTAQPKREFLEQRLPPPVYRPANAPAAQPAGNGGNAPPVYSPNATVRLQRKESRPAPAARTATPTVTGPLRTAGLFLPRTIQRSAKERLSQFNKERKAIYTSMDFDYGTPEDIGGKKQYGGQASLDDIAAGAFSSLGSASTGAVAYMKDGKLLFASQTGNAASAMGAVSGMGTCVAADGKIPNSNMHAEMIIIYYCLTSAINPGDIQAIGVKDKGCCRLCSAMLKHLGIAFTRTEDSKYEIQWVNPYLSAGKASPIDLSSGVSAMERQLL